MENKSTPRTRFEKLTATNYEIWINHVRDHLLSEELEEVYDCSEIEVGAAGDVLAAIAAVAARTARTKKLKTLWSFLRNHLSEEIYRKTLDPTAVTFGDTVALLRYLRKNWHNNSVYDRANIRETFNSLTLETCKDMDDFIMEFKSQKALMTKYGIGLIAVDEDALFAFHQKLPVAYKDNQLHVMANGMDFSTALAYYKNVANCFPDVPGSTHPSVIKQPESAHNAVEICRMFAASGKCRFGQKCKFSHVSQPHTASEGPANHNFGNSSSKSNRFSGKCNYCGIKGHKEQECFKKKRQENKKATDAAAAAKETVTPESTNAQSNSHSKSVSFGDSIMSLNDLSYGLFDQRQATPPEVLRQSDPREHAASVDAVGADIVTAIRQGFPTPLAKEGDLIMLVDGGATSVIIQDRTKLSNLRPANIAIKVGGGLLTCKQVGDFYYVARANGKFVVNHAVARYMPDFGFDILPESLYLAAGALIVKGKSTLEAKNGNNVLLIAEKHPRCWLYFAKITPISAPPQGTSYLSPFFPKEKAKIATHAHAHSASVAQECSDSASLALGHAYPTFIETAHITIDSDAFEGANYDKSVPEINLVARSQSISSNELLLWHRKYGHRNFKDVCTMLGIPVPAKLPVCTTCIQAKSKRHPLRRRDTPLYDAPRPGYAWSCDFAGPFRCTTAGGNQYLSVKVDVYSKFIAPRMAKTPAEFLQEFKDFVAELESDAGHPHVVAQLIADSASYYKLNKELIDFCRKKGIIRLYAPPQTQSLNGLAERTIAVLIEMAVAMLIDSGLPRRFYGEALMYASYLLNRLPFAAGTRVTRLEMYKQKLLPNQHSHTHTFGCAAYKQLAHPLGKPVDKLDAKSKLCIFIGVNTREQTYRLIEPVHFGKVEGSAHCIFVEDMLPAKKTSSINTGSQIFAPLNWDTQERQEGDQTPARSPTRAITTGAPRRSDREWAPSGSALRNLALGPPEPPRDLQDEHEGKHDTDAGIAAAEFHHDVVFASTPDSPSINDALTGPDKLKWRAALISEVQSHIANKTLGPPLSEIPPGFTAIPLDVITKVKRDGRMKMRAILKGYLMMMGMHFNQTFAPVPQISTFRFFLALSCFLDWEIWQGDYRTAFLGAEMDTELYTKVPNWFRLDPDPTDTGFTYHRVLKAIPGCPQGPRLFHKKSHSVYTKKMKLIQSKQEYTLYFDKERQLFLLVWVDDTFLFFPTSSTKAAAALWKGLQGEFDLADAEPISDCLGCIITRDRAHKRMFLSQDIAITKLLIKSGLGLAAPADTPLVPGKPLSSADCPTEAERLVLADQRRWYLSTVASLIYFSHWTRPDMAHAVSKLCRFMHNPGKPHITALKRALRYLKGTANYGLLYDFSKSQSNLKLGIYGLYDAAHADCPDTLKSTTAYLFFLAGSLISWHTKLHTYITTSTNHSEYCTAAKASREAKWFSMLASTIGFAHLASPVNLFSDSKGAISMTHNPVHRSASKHVDLADHYARECQERGITTVSYLNTAEMTADLLTKQLPRIAFEKHRATMGVTPQPSWI